MSTRRSEGWKKIVYTEDHYALCKNDCGKACPSRRQLYCSAECRQEYAIKNFPAHARAFVLERDHGICAVCGLDTIALERRWRKARSDESRFAYGRGTPGPGTELVDWRAEQKAYGVGLRISLWDMDHILSVVDGGGQTGLENLQTLCLPHHRAKTAELRQRLAQGRKGMRETQTLTIALPL